MMPNGTIPPRLKYYRGFGEKVSFARSTMSVRAHTLILKLANSEGTRGKTLPGMSSVKGGPYAGEPSCFPSIKGFRKNRQKKGTSGEKEDSGCGDDLCYVSQMLLYLFPLVPCPFFICVPGFHKKLHQSFDRKDFHQDGFLIYNEQSFEISFDHRQTSYNDRILKPFFSMEPSPSYFPVIYTPGRYKLQTNNFSVRMFMNGRRPKGR